MGYGRWGPWYSWLKLPGLAAALACVCRLHTAVGRPAALVSDESALETCISDDALYKLTIFTFLPSLPTKTGALVWHKMQNDISFCPSHKCDRQTDRHTDHTTCCSSWCHWCSLISATLPKRRLINPSVNLYFSDNCTHIFSGYKLKWGYLAYTLNLVIEICQSMFCLPQVVWHIAMLQTQSTWLPLINVLPCKMQKSTARINLLSIIQGSFHK